MLLLYFITTVDGFVTVGLTKNIERRLYDLQAGNPHELSCRAVIAFPSREEALAAQQRIEDKLADSYENGRWYRLTPLAKHLMKAATPYQRPRDSISRGRRSAVKGDSDRHPRSSIRWSEIKWPVWMDEVDRTNMMRLHRTPGAVRDAVRRLSKRYRNRQ